MDPSGEVQLAMGALFESGHVVDVIIGLVVVEGLVLALFYQRRHRGISLGDLWPNLLSGAGLLMALRAALTGSSWQAIAPWLIVALAAHLIDLRRRWRSQ